MSKKPGICSKEKSSYRDTILAKIYASKWLLSIIMQDIKFNDELFECIGYCCGGLQTLTRNIISIMEQKNNSHSFIPEEVILNLDTASSSLLPDTLESLIEDYPFMKSKIKCCIFEELNKVLQKRPSLSNRNSPVYQLKNIFILDGKSLEFCYFLFASSEYVPIKDYFRIEVEIFEYDKTALLATILGISEQKCKDLRNMFQQMGLTHESHVGPLLPEEITKSIKGIGDKSLKELLCSPIGKSDLALNDFDIPEDDINYVLKLLGKSHHQPVHILLYGPAGVGKSSFAKSLAKHLGVKAFEVLSGANKGTSDRKASFCACLNAAKNCEKSFVLVDEADSLLDVLNDDYSHGTSAKAWLNSLMESKDHRVIWIVNSPSYIDPSVKRRFAYSIYFKNLTIDQQIGQWVKITKKLKVENKLPLATIKRLATTYSAPVSCIETSIKLAKITATKHEFIGCVERNLKAYRTLLNNGNTPRNPLLELDECVLDGISTSIQVRTLLDKIRKIDAKLKSQEITQPGMQNLLFFGVSGAGKSYLSKYIAKELNRPCIIKRGSDLISKWVGSTEANIREAFEEASYRDAVLILDEADIFIPNRQVAQNEWDVSMAAEMLTCLEKFRSICICTTNFQSYIDNAAIRRFSIKVRFDYAKPSHLEALYNNMLAPLAGTALEFRELEMLKSFRFLCVSDFATVRRQFLLEDKPNISHISLLQALASEERIKREHGVKKLGFMA